jgi:hypothetical protein
LLEKISEPPGSALPDFEIFKRIAENNGIQFIDGNGRVLRNAENKGITTKAADTAHWNNHGHQIVANVLKRYFEENW